MIKRMKTIKTIILESKVSGHEGPCTPTWLNRNYFDFREAKGVTGFFRSVHNSGHSFFYRKTGPEFHGIIKEGCVYTTEKPIDHDSVKMQKERIKELKEKRAGIKKMIKRFEVIIPKLEKLYRRKDEGSN